MKLFALVAALLAPFVQAHTIMGMFWINDVSQGDGTCIRMPKDGSTSTAPIYNYLSNEDMACGPDGEIAVQYTCPAPSGAKLTFQYRLWPNLENPGVIASGHKGPIAVYVKKVGDMSSDEAAGPGWIKIWEDGYDAQAGKWAVDKLIENDGLFSIELPSGLPSGYYLVRTELLALHQAYRGDPQFYVSCAQIFITSGPKGELSVPSGQQVSIPGYLEGTEMGVSFNLFDNSDPAEYEVPGPKPYFPVVGIGAMNTVKQTDGTIPGDCKIVNGNWCGFDVPDYDDEESCWDAVRNCYEQEDECWQTAPPSGNKNCPVWHEYCESLEPACKVANPSGPKNKGEKLGSQYPEGPFNLPPPYAGADRVPIENTPIDDEDDEKQEESIDETLISTELESEDDIDERLGEGDEGDEGDEEEIISTDGTCGGETGMACAGSEFGDCCSKAGWCGNSRRHCTCGCQEGFSSCGKKHIQNENSP